MSADEQSLKLLSQRLRMVDDQIAARGIHDAAVLAAMRSVPRHLFVNNTHVDEAYTDHPVPIGFDQTISQPYIVAFMLSLLDLKTDSRVLEIGTGCGYQTALLAEIVREVFSIEILPALLYRANQTLGELGYKNVHTMLGDGNLGWPAQAPFDAIIVAAASPEVPERLVEQLADGGRLVIPLIDETGGQHLHRFIRRGSSVEDERLLPVRFVPLRLI